MITLCAAMIKALHGAIVRDNKVIKAGSGEGLEMGVQGWHRAWRSPGLQCKTYSSCIVCIYVAIGHMKHGGEGYEDQEGRGGDWQGVCLGQADRKSPPAHHWARTRKTRWTNRWVLLNNETILDASLHHTAGAEIPILRGWGPYNYIHVACVKTGLCQRLKWITSAWQWAYFGSMLGHNLHKIHLGYESYEDMSICDQKHFVPKQEM